MDGVISTNLLELSFGYQCEILLFYMTIVVFLVGPGAIKHDWVESLGKEFK
jgi:hypothetical protein